MSSPVSSFPVYSHRRFTRRRHHLQLAGGTAAMPLLLACNPLGGQQGPRLTTEPVELSYRPYAEGSPVLLPTLQQVVREFTVKYPNLKVNLLPGDFDPEYAVKLQASVAAGTPPDAHAVHHQEVRDYGPNGTFQDLNRFLKRDGYPKEHVGWEPYRWQGKQYAVPWGLQTSCIFYNKQLFDQAGVPVPPDNWTWDQFTDAARRLTKHATDEAQTIWGAGDYGGGNYQWMNALLTMYGGGILNASRTESALTTAPSLDALEFRSGWVPRLRITPPTAAVGPANALFLQGRVAMQVIGVFFVGNIKSSQIGDQPIWDMAPLPRGPKRRAGVSHTIGQGLPTGIRHPEESWALVKHLTSPEGMVPFARVGRAIPANRKFFDTAVPQDGRPSRFKQAALDAWDELALDPPFTPQARDAMRMWNEELDPVWRGERSVRDGALAFKQKMDGLLKELKGKGLL